jgi:glycosyltransferase involved in cell wall biosynthesis
MRILFLHRFKVIGGAERQLVALARGLRDRGHDVTLLTFYSGGEMLADADRVGLRIVSLRKRGRWDVFPFLIRLIRELRANRAEIVHGYLGMANALLVLAKPIHRARVAWGVRASDIDLARYSRLVRFDAWLETALGRFPDLIIANSESGKRHAIIRGFPAGKITVIPNGIDLDRFQRDECGRIRVRAELGVCPDQPLVGRIGRIDPQKDYPTFLQAAAIVALEGPDVRFVVAGDDRFGREADLKALADRLGIADRLIWAGERIDMPAVYSALDLCVSSSAYGEGTPNVLIEAMACGVPCVTTDAGDSELVVGNLGSVAPCRDAAALADAILRRLAADSDPVALRAHVAARYALADLILRSEAALAGLLAEGWRTSGGGES